MIVIKTLAAIGMPAIAAAVGVAIGKLEEKWHE